ncbi:C6 transcription factor, putative [Talaromyces stipitatus ATCC 10500]|uniref:C6 transcription factor, putative n=1 Tax=Talaromyces stipitatus (strain ATCC 10500 / CBS 375.48 / QM 6759 / NRRL 1006) TaxID=441959 RepID=B8MJ54_TALSN|nr:C6 transcription factor, putative [Talaromyces stipitatus ATCC 10500]EED15716.1 C6 transcription factor, putative [Talaromyces stipitatus ATCC 10500]
MYIGMKQDTRAKETTTEEARHVNSVSEIAQSTNGTRSFQGTISKTRVYGNGHWMTLFAMVEDLSILEPVGEVYGKVFQRSNYDPTDDIAKAFNNCKQLARDLKRQRPSRRRLPAAIYLSFPDPQVMEELIRLYFNMFESCYRIIYQPSFIMEYRRCVNQLEIADSSFLLQLILVMTAAGRLHGDITIRNDIAAKAQTWIHIAQTWISAPLEKDRLTLKSIQVQCLLLLCRQIYQVGADLVWISAGSLIRMAMHMGLHQDPNNLEDMNELQKQIRRRLWYTILEMNVQAALDSGMSPMIRDADYNTQPPSDASDSHLLQVAKQQQRPHQEEGGEEETEADELHEGSTRSSLQAILVKSLPLRLEVTRIINSLQEEPTYEHILTIGNKLAFACGEVVAMFDQAASTIVDLPARRFAQSYCIHLIRRFPLCLHFRYAVKSRKNFLYSHSQKVSLEAALDIISLLDDHVYGRLLLSGSGMFRDIVTRVAVLIFLELCPDPEAEVSNAAKRRYRERQTLLLQDAQRLVRYAEDRIREGETSVKTYVFLRLMMAQAEARFNGSSLTESNTTKVLKHALDKCEKMLNDRLAATKINDHEADSGHFLETWTLNGMSASHSEFEIENFNEIDFDFLSEQFPSQWVDQTWF